MKIKLLGEKRTLLAEIAGELDHHSAALIKEELDEKLRSTNAVNIIFDLSNLDFMDSSGIGVIMGRYKKTRTLGGQCIVCTKNAQIIRILEMAGIDKIIKFAPSAEKALRILDK